MENISLETVPTCSFYFDITENLRFTWAIHLVISINVALCITATLGNMLILVALQKDCHLRPPSKLLFRSLASSDLCVGLISQPCFVIFLISATRQSWLSICQITEGIVHISSAILSGVSLYTLTAISVDRLLALLLLLRYRQVVTLARVRAVVIISWLVLVSNGMLYFWTVRIFLIALGINALLCLVASSFCYMKIYFTLRYRQAQVLHQSGPGQLNVCNQWHVLRYKKTVSSSLRVFLAGVILYLPFIFVVVEQTIRGESRSTVNAQAITATLVFLNSSLNPIIYCWKISEVRQAVKATIRRFCSG